MVIADNCAEYANLIFNNSSDYYGSTLALGAVFSLFKSMVTFLDILTLLLELHDFLVLT